MRLTSEQLNDIKIKYGVSELYSWSKIECFRMSPYEFYLKYVLKKKPDREDSIYAPLGGQVHNILEKYYKNEIPYESMIYEWEDSWLTCYELAKLKFDRSDSERNQSIGNKYYQDISHFFKNHKKIETKVELERFLSVKIGDYVLQGYADLITKDNEGNFVIADWKTSTVYQNKVAEEKCGQLVAYALALNQLGVPMERIRICWNFVKYCNVEVSMKNGKKKDRIIERYKLGESLVSNAQMWLKDYGCNEEEIDNYLKQIIDTNSIDYLPEEVRNKFSIDDCYIFVPLIQKLIDEWTNIIITTIKDIEYRLVDFNKSKSIKCFWDTEESVKANSFYFSNLCSFSPALHLPYGAYLDKLEHQKNNTDLFGGLLGSNESVKTSNVIDNKNDEPDLSWLDSII